MHESGFTPKVLFKIYRPSSLSRDETNEECTSSVLMDGTAESRHKKVSGVKNMLPVVCEESGNFRKSLIPLLAQHASIQLQ